MPIIGGRGAGVRGLGFQGAGAPAQVTGLTATDVGSGRAFNNGRIDLSWAVPATNGAPITGYRIERSTNGSTYSTLVASHVSTSYSDTGLTSAQQYWYRVAAINAVGTGLNSSAANATATTVPQAPVIGTVTAGNGQVTVDASTLSSGGKPFNIYVATSSPGSITGSSIMTPVTVSGLANGTSYTFTITVSNDNGTSLPSSASNSVTPVAPFSASGGTTFTSGGYTYHRFTANGTFSISSGSKNIEVLAIGGGGSGGTGASGASTSNTAGSGGGAGGVVYTSGSYSSGTSWPITIGGGGSGGAKFNAGGNSGTSTTVATLGLTANGGGRGTNSGAGIAGGSGGGGATTAPSTVNGPGGSANAGTGMTTGYANVGGSTSGFSSGCGGGGSGAAGANGTSNQSGTNGGSGTNAFSTWATATSTGVSGFYAGGGGGAYATATSNLYGSGGSGGATAGSGTTSSATANTGSGSGGTAKISSNQFSGSGGSGLVIIRYLT